MSKSKIEKLTVLTVSFNTPEYIKCLIKSFEKFKPVDINIEYIVVENSQLNFKEELLSITEHVTFLNNPTKEIGSEANASGLEFGKKHVNTDYCFICHSDVLVSSYNFFNFLFTKISDGYEIIGTMRDNIRINALHVSGIFLKSDLLKSINTYPIYKNGDLALDVGDTITEYARNNNIKHISMNNTMNDKGLYSKINNPYNLWGPDCGVCRGVNDSNEVIFLHLGRGTPKYQKTFSRAGKKTTEDWIAYSETLLA